MSWLTGGGPGGLGTAVWGKRREWGHTQKVRTFVAHIHDEQRQCPLQGKQNQGTGMIQLVDASQPRGPETTSAPATGSSAELL